jgi:hypothetical protein
VADQANYRLRDGGYKRIERSEIPQLADLDLDLLTRCVLLGQTSNAEAVKTFRRQLQQK